MSVERNKATIRETARDVFLQVIEGGEIGVHETHKIANATGLTIRQVADARGNSRRDGILPRPTRELTSLTMRTQSATVFPMVRDYRDMGFSLEEIQRAVRMEKGIELSYESVHGAVKRATKNGHLRKLSNEEYQDIRTDTRALTAEEITENVTSMLELRSKLLIDKLPFPANRLEWKKAARQIPKSNLLNEWIRLSKLLGHSPLPHEIDNLYMESATKFSRSVYEGEVGKGDFEKTKDLLNCLADIQAFADTILNNPLAIVPHPVAKKDVLEARERILTELSSVLTLDDVDKLREKTLALKEKIQRILKELTKKPHPVSIYIEEDERLMWESALANNLQDGILAQGNITQEDLDLIGEYFGKGLIGDGLDTGTFDRFSLDFVTVFHAKST